MPSLANCSIGFRIGSAVLGIILGLVVFVVFWVEYHNVNTSVWGFVSAVAAALTLYVHVTYVKRWYENDPSPLMVWMHCGCFFQLAGVCGLVVYIVLAVKDNQGILIYGPGYYLAAVWCFMTLKWGFQLFFFSRLYWRKITIPCLLLPPSEKPAMVENYGGKS